MSVVFRRRRLASSAYKLVFNATFTGFNMLIKATSGFASVSYSYIERQGTTTSQTKRRIALKINGVFGNDRSRGNLNY